MAESCGNGCGLKSRGKGQGDSHKWFLSDCSAPSKSSRSLKNPASVSYFEKGASQIAVTETKKRGNLKAALALYFEHCKLVRIHQTVRVTPAE